jgi:hypothetical protein
VDGDLETNVIGYRFRADDLGQVLVTMLGEDTVAQHDDL